MNIVDKELIDIHPELKYVEETLEDGRLSPRTIYGRIRLFSFRINYLNGSLPLERCIRLANMAAIAGTWHTFNQQGKTKEYDFLTTEEIDELLNAADKHFEDKENNE